MTFVLMRWAISPLSSTLGRPPLAGRHSPLTISSFGRSGTSGIINSSGRQSPSHQNKGHPKINSSPIMRRVRKSSTGRPVLISGQSSTDPSLNIRKSISMDNMAAWSAHNRDISGKLVETCEEYLDEKNEAVSADHEKESAEFADTDTTTDETGNKSELCENHLANDAKFQEALKIVDENG